MSRRDEAGAVADWDQIAKDIAAMGYSLVKQVGSGGSARVFLVLSEKYQMLFVAKVMSLESKQICGDCEIAALRQLTAPNVIALYGVSILPHALYLVLEYCPHGSLLEHVRRTGPLQGRQLYGVCKGILTGLAYIHSQNFAHQDLKPANLLIDRYGRVKLADFGISGLFADHGMSSTHAGTFMFMAPELGMKKTFDPFKADIWSAGVTLYYLAMGKVPWQGDTEREFWQEMNAGLVNLPRQLDLDFGRALQSMITVEPTHRPSAADCLTLPVFADADTKDGVIQFGQEPRGPVLKPMMIHMPKRRTLSQKVQNGPLPGRIPPCKSGLSES
jgi:serine/threonine protein kinase